MKKLLLLTLVALLVVLCLTAFVSPAWSGGFSWNGGWSWNGGFTWAGGQSWAGGFNWDGD